MILRRITIKT